MKLLACFPWLAALVRWRARRDPERSAIRAIADEAVRTRTLGHRDAGPLMRELAVEHHEQAGPAATGNAE